MKKMLRFVCVVLVAACLVLGLAGCGEDQTLPGGRTALSTPGNVRVDDAGKTALILRWDAVEGADKYELSLDGELKQFDSSITNYDLKKLADDPKVYPIKIRALAANGDKEYKDSSYSSPTNVEPAKYIFTYGDDAGPANARSARSGSRQAGNGKVTITGLTQFGQGLARVVIPPTIGSGTVSVIGNDAFKNNTVMQSVVLPETLTSIGSSAFAGTDITSIRFPESVTSVGDGAFSGCTVLVVVVFVSAPDLGTGVFEGALDIKSIVVPETSGAAFAEAIAQSLPAELSGTIEDIITKVAITGIEITTKPSKTIYTAGETLNTNGIVVTATFSDKTTQIITSGLSFTPVTLDEVGTITISVSYAGLRAEFTVTVNAAPYYTVTFNANGGSLMTSGTTAGSSTYTVQVEAGKTVTPPSAQPIRAGYTFSYWRQNNQQFNFNTPITSNITLYAEWTQNSTGGSYNPALNGTWVGKGIGSWEQSGYIQPCSLHQSQGGDSTCQDCKYVEGDSGTYEFDIELTLTNGAYEIGHPDPQAKGTFTTTATAFTMTPTQVYISEEEAANNGSASVSTGKWYTRDELKNTMIASGQFTSAEAEQEVSEIFASMAGSYTVNTTTLTLTVIVNGMSETQTFTKKGTASGGDNGNKTYYTVTFNANGGSLMTSGTTTGSTGSSTYTVQVEAGKTVTPPSVQPVRTGYTFSYWRQNNQQFNFNTPINSDITLYAEWTQNSTGGDPGNGGTATYYTVTFNANGGYFGTTGSTGGSTTMTKQIAAGTSWGAAPSDVVPLRDGYTFSYWWQNNQQFNFNTPINSDITLYAEWVSL